MSDNLDGLLSSFLRRKRLEAARPFVRGKVLDYGCGIGLAGDLADEDGYVGVDIDPDVLVEARRRHPRGRFLTPAELPGLSAGPFETILALAVIEHLPAPRTFLELLASRLQAGGRIVVTTPAPGIGLGPRPGRAIYGCSRAKAISSINR